MIEQHLDIPTADGAMNSFVVHPEEGGPIRIRLQAALDQLPDFGG